MKKLNLCLHVDSEVSTLDDVANTATPAATETHYPIPHVELIDRTRDRLRENGIEVLAEQHALNESGERYFGLMQTDIGGSDGDYTTVVGLRNSHDKSFAAGLVAGSGVFVCDNLSFHGEISVSRVHTRHVLSDLEGLLDNGVGALRGMAIQQEKRVVAYKDAELDNSTMHDLIFRAAVGGAVTKSRMLDVRNEFLKPRHDEFGDRNLWSLFNAFTEAFKPRGRGGSVTAVDRLAMQSRRLHGVFDRFVGLVS